MNNRVPGTVAPEVKLQFIPVKDFVPLLAVVLISLAKAAVNS